MAVTITITMTDAGQVQVGGPLQEKILMYGLLEAAREAVREWHIQNQRLVQPVSLGIPDPLKGS